MAHACYVGLDCAQLHSVWDAGCSMDGGNVNKPNYNKGPGDLWEEEEDFPDITDDREPVYVGEDYDADIRETGRADFEYDPLSRGGFE